MGLSFITDSSAIAVQMCTRIKNAQLTDFMTSNQHIFIGSSESTYMQRNNSDQCLIPK